MNTDELFFRALMDLIAEAQETVSRPVIAAILGATQSVYDQCATHHMRPSVAAANLQDYAPEQQYWVLRIAQSSWEVGR
jgi:hypothetical protein